MLKACFSKKLWHFIINVNIKVNNEILVLWGPSGAGKTTILHCLAGLDRPSSGIIKLNKRILYSFEEKVDISTRFRNIGYLFQDCALFPHKTVKENVLYGLGGKKQCHKDLSMDPLKLLKSFGVEHLIERYPHQLSGGEKQRVALARALAVRPKLLLLDEPFSALDRLNKVKLRRELKKLHGEWKIPFILVTHDEEDAKFLGDVIIALEKGRSRQIDIQKQFNSRYQLAR